MKPHRGQVRAKASAPQTRLDPRVPHPLFIFSIGATGAKARPLHLRELKLAPVPPHISDT